MNRNFYVSLTRWKDSKQRKPLILQGARQVGKTYGTKAWSKKHYKNLVYLNFEKDRQLSALFEGNLQPLEILHKIEMHFKVQFNAESDLLFLDEIQQCGKALHSLKYFSEDLPEAHIIAAGSLLGLHLNSEPFPVGKVQFLDIYPMTFVEFLEALNKKELYNFSWNKEINAHDHIQLIQYLKYYLLTGGTPEVVSTFISMNPQTEECWIKVRELQSHLMTAYLADMAKHCGKLNAMNLERLWQNIPNQLAKEQNKRFHFKNVLPGKNKYSQMSDLIDWLTSANLIYKVPIANQASLPLSAYTKESFFKLFVFDVGLLAAMSDISHHEILNYNFGTFKGSFIENFVLQELTYLFGRKIYSFCEGESEVDFIIQHQGKATPIEVKAGVNRKAKSIQRAIQKYELTKALRLSLENLTPTDNSKKLQDIPLYCAGDLQIYK